MVGDGFAVEFVDCHGVMRREPLSCCVSVAFEEAAPAREFPMFKGQGSFAGQWWSATVGRHVGYESWLERDHAMLLDFDPMVVGLASQPFRLRWRANGRLRGHVPDYFARMADGGRAVIDVRPDDRIEPKDAEAFEATAEACRRLGWQFRRVGQPDAVLTANVRWLSRYRHRRCGRREDLSVRLHELLSAPTPLFDAAARAGDRLAVLPALYHLMWRQLVVGDLISSVLGPSTLVRVAEAAV